MRKTLLVLILPFLVFACGDDLFDISFAYEFAGDFDLPALEAGLHNIDSDEIELAVLDELENRNLASVSSASLRYLTLEIPSTSDLDWSFVESAEVFMYVDGVETPMASILNIPETVGKKIELNIDANEYKLMTFLDAKTAQARLRVNLREALPQNLLIEVVAGTQITAAATE